MKFHHSIFRILSLLLIINSYAFAEKPVAPEKLPGMIKVDAEAGTASRVHFWESRERPENPPSVRITTAPWSMKQIMDGKTCLFATLDELPVEAVADREGRGGRFLAGQDFLA